MAKLVLVRAGPNVSRLMYPVFYGFAALLGLALIGGLIGGASTIVLVVFAFLFVLFLIVPIREHVIQVKIKKALKSLKNIVISLEDENKLEFSKPLRIKPIIFEVKARKSWGPRGPYYSWSTKIEPRGVYETKSTHIFEDISYGIVVNKSGEGGAILPGVEFDEYKIRDIVLLYIPPKQPFIQASYHTLKSPWGQIVEIKIYEGLGIRGEAKLLGGGEASIYLVAELPESLHQVRFKLADLKSGEVTRFLAKPALNNPTLVIAHKKSSLRGLVWHLTKPLIAGNILQYSLVVVFRQGILKKFIEKVELHVIK